MRRLNRHADDLPTRPAPDDRPGHPARWLTPAEVAEALQVSVDLVYGWLRSGELRGLNVNAHRGAGRPTWRISLSDLAMFEASRSRGVGIVAKVRRRPSPDVIEFF